jgi:hypothetical protein
MARFVIDMHGSPLPKRGDLLQTNVGDRRERTWFILAIKALKPVRGLPWVLTGSWRQPCDRALQRIHLSRVKVDRQP